jgi:putative transposase
MPNHVHGIIVICRGGMTPPLQKPTLGQIVAYFKYQSTKGINSIDDSEVITNIWQRNYYEHIIRGQNELERIWKYIESNPIMWTGDDENPIRL